MIDQELIEHFVRSKFVLQTELSQIGEIPGSSEIESQMMFIEARLKAKIKQSVCHSIEEMTALRLILIEANKPDEET